MTAFCLAAWMMVQEPGGVPSVHSQPIAGDKFAATRAAEVRRLFDVAAAAAPVPDRPYEVAVACRSLGHMRAAEAVPALLDHLAFDPYGGLLARGSLPVFVD